MVTYPTPFIREYNEWIMVKLHQMSQLVSQANDITERELKFIEAYPLHSLLETQAAGLLEEAKQIMENLVSTVNHEYIYF